MGWVSDGQALRGLCLMSRAHALWSLPISGNRQTGWYTQNNTYSSVRFPWKLHFTQQLCKCLRPTAQRSEPERVSAKVKDGRTKRRRSCGTSSACWGSRFLEARCSSITGYYLVTLEKFLTWLSLHCLGYKIWKTTSARPVYLDRLWGSRKTESYLKTIKNFKNVRHDECGGDDVDESLYAGWVSRGMCTQICPEPINENRLREPDTW